MLDGDLAGCISSGTEGGVLLPTVVEEEVGFVTMLLATLRKRFCCAKPSRGFRKHQDPSRIHSRHVIAGDTFVLSHICAGRISIVV